MQSKNYSDPTLYSRKINYEIKKIDKVTATELVQANHYSPVMPKLTKHWLGVFKNDELVGVITLGWGTQPKHTIQKIVSKDLASEDYYEIGKMCLLDSEIKNSETQMISQVVDWLRNHNEDRNREIKAKNKQIRKDNWINKTKPGFESQPEIPQEPEVGFLYTLADGIMGKCGYVYQAANFYYGGEYWTDSYMSSKGEKVHPRTTRQLCFDNWDWHYDPSSPGYKPEFAKTHESKAREKHLDYISKLEHAIRNLPADTSKEQRQKIHNFAHNFYRATYKYDQLWANFHTSGLSFTATPRPLSFLPSLPKGTAKLLPNPKKDWLKKQQVFWLTPEFMKHIGLRKIKGKMFRYMFPLNKEATKILKKSSTKWELGPGVYPKKEDLKWKELVGRKKSVVLEGMPDWDLSVVEHNKKNVNAHKK